MRRWAVILLLSVWAFPGNARPVKSLLEYRQEGVVIQKWDNSCGAAALATILTYYLGHPITERAVAQGLLRGTEPLRVRHRGGFSLFDMKRFLAGIGYRGEGYAEARWQDLGKLAPSIVPIKVRGYDHFVVLRGITASHALIADPGFGNYRLTRAEFLESWTSRVAFIVTTKERWASHENDIGGRRSDNAGGPERGSVPDND